MKNVKKIGFYLAHPAHFHLFKNVIASLINDQHKVFVVYNDKDVLHDLVKSSVFANISYRIKANKKVESKFALLVQFVFKNIGAFKIFYKQKPDFVFGTPILISLISRLLPYKSVIVNEDDFDIISKTANLGYPHADHILCPIVCRTTSFGEKSIQYNSYHELAYLHPDHFIPDVNKARLYVDINKPYAIIRFAKLFAHHDDGIKGINANTAKKLIEILEPFVDIYITSERKLEKELEKYRIAIDAKDMHDVMAYASLYIGDSQTMAAEAGVLGIPFIRFNDFVGRIGYLDELENKYKLGFGIKTNDTKGLIDKVKELVSMEDRTIVFQNRRKKMLSEKINYADFLVWFIDDYPNSAKIMKENPDYQNKFKKDNISLGQEVNQNII